MAGFKSDPERALSLRGVAIRCEASPLREAISHTKPLEIWSAFKSECKLRGVHVCCVMESLMLAWIEGQRAEATVIKPVTVNVTLNHVVKKLRSRAGSPGPHTLARAQRWPPNCEHVDKFLRPQKQVGCLELRDWIPLEKCWLCHQLKGG